MQMAANLDAPGVQTGECSEQTIGNWQGFVTEFVPGAKLQVSLCAPATKSHAAEHSCGWCSQRFAF